MALSNHDQAIFSALFDAEGVVSQQHDAPRRPEISTKNIIDARRDEEISQEEAQVIKSVDSVTASAAELSAAITYFDELIQMCPHRPSSYANRAQVRRLQLADNALFTAEFAEVSKFIMADLDTAISLSSGQVCDDTTQSSTRAVLAAAHAHRGFLLLRAVQMTANGKRPVGLGADLDGASADTLEELASRDFAVCGRLGNADARQIAVATNPYAKMCGNIVHEAMERERSAFITQQAL